MWHSSIPKANIGGGKALDNEASLMPMVAGTEAGIMVVGLMIDSFGDVTGGSGDTTGGSGAIVVVREKPG
jgi:hypothetical protein